MCIKNVKKNKKYAKKPRIYINEIFTLNKVFDLSKEHTHYIKTVLKMKINDILEIFNNTNYIFFAEIVYMSKTTIKLKILKYQLKNVESPIYIHLGQMISKNEKMDFTIQKSIEMGVNVITPLFSENSHMQENYIKISNKIQRWKKIAIASCQQCRRNVVPVIHYPKHIFSWCENNQYHDTQIMFHPKSKLTLNHLSDPIKSIRIIIGSEGGFSEHEIQKIVQYGFISIKLGPRILRTETASIVAITALQMKFGDLNI